MDLSLKSKREFCATPCQDEASSRDSSSKWNISLPYDVLRDFFKRLNVRDLSSSLMVCRLWKAAAIDEYSTRGPYYALVNLGSSMSDYKEVLQVYPLLKYEDLPIKPAFGIIFMGFPDTFKSIDSICPSSCKTIVVYALGIIQDKNQIDCLSSSRALFMLFPHIPNVQIHIVEMKDKVKFDRCLEQTLIQLPVVNRRISTICIIFYKLQTFPELHYMPYFLQPWKHKISSVWGGQIEHVDNVKNSQWHDTSVIIFISGAIKTWCITLDANCNTVELIEKRLLSFKERVKLRKHSVGFMLSSVPDISKLEPRNNIELRIFKELFPKVSLVGCIARSVFAKNLSDPEEEIWETQEIPDVRNTRGIFNDNVATSFMILSYG